MRPILTVALLAHWLGSPTPCHALSPGVEALRVDLGPALGRKDTRTPGWEDWQVEDGPEARRRFGSVTVTLRPAGDGSGLRGFWRKAGLVHGATMAIDGVAVRGAGRSLELVLSGLEPGRHSLATFHSSNGAEAAGKLRVELAGGASARASVTVTPGHRVTHNDDVPSAYLSFEVSPQTDAVVLRIGPDDAASADLSFLNGFELDGVDPARRARKPSPEDGDEHVDGDDGRVTLSWTAAATARSHRVFLVSADGRTEARALVREARADTAAHAGTPQSTRLEVSVSSNDSLRHYAWRVDTIDAEGKISRGEPWSFRTRHLAFPGAEGHGRFARGGRGGRVIAVTSLADSGPGTLREAVEAQGPRTVVFNVSGLITLESKLIFRNPFLTVAGQTAPGKGVCIRGSTFGGLGARDTIIRFLRVRPGDLSGKTLDGMGLASCDHCIVDHCSISWTIDEAFSSRGARNITLQRTLISEALNQAGHRKYPPGTRHGYAASIGGDIGSFHHNLLAHCAGRNWSLAGGLDQAARHTGRLDIRNNVVYNWDHRTTDGGAMEVQFVGNYYKPGPASRVFHVLKPERNPHFGPQDYYVAGNVMEGHYGPEPPLAGVVAPRDEPLESFIVEKPFFPAQVRTQTAREAYTGVIADVGCNVPTLDDHDRRILDEVVRGTTTHRGSRTGLPGIIDSQRDVGGWETYPEIRRPSSRDSDHDGMPNRWELERKLDPNNPGDGAADPDGDGYTNLEDYLNALALGR